MIIPDINLLLYAYDSDSPFHDKAVVWWQHCLSGTEPVGLPAVVALGFVRVATSARAFRDPMSVAEAASCVRSWLERPMVRVVDPDPDHVGQVLKMLETIGAAGNLVTDAQIAALALACNAVVHTADADFQRFPGLRWINPLTGVAGARPRRKR
jgi:uncharacterized protein